MNFNKRVYYICKQIPEGKVATYGQIAILAQNPRAARQVGWALNKNKEGIELPAHRIINRIGFLSGAASFSEENEQKNRLLAEGIEISTNLKVDLKKYRWNPSIQEQENIIDYFNLNNI